MSNNTHAAVVRAWERLWQTGKNKNKKIDSNQATNNTTLRNTPHSNTQAHVRAANTSIPRDTPEEPKKLRRLKNHRHPPTLLQQDLQGQPQELLDGEAFGDLLVKKTDNTLRIMLHNINRLPSQRQTVKSKQLVSMIANRQIDIALLTEIGLYWKLVKTEDQWHERVRESFQASRTELAYNKTEPNLTAMVQFGGAAAIAVDDASHRLTSQGQDTTNLGRWAWLRFEGKQGHFLRVVSAYRPVTNNSPGPGTVQAQHERFFGKEGRDEGPREAFYTDLMADVIAWKALGDHIVIGLDANEDVRRGDTATIFASLGMREVILDAHANKSPPATCDKNMNREPIDGIFATPGLGILAGGYSPFNSGCPSDHRYLWIDITYQDAYGYPAPPLVSPEVRRLKTTDLKMVKKYNARVHLTLQCAGLFDALTSVSERASSLGWSLTLEDEYNRINDSQYQVRKNVESKIRHLRMGAIEWSPKLQSFRTAIEVWSLMLKKRKQQRSISNCKLRRLLSKTSIQDAYSKSVPELEDALTAAFSDYREARNKAPVWRDEFLTSLAASRAEVKGTEKDAELKQLRSIELQKRVARNIKRMQGKLQRNATLQIIVNDSTGRHVVTDKEAMEEACIDENLSRFTQSEGTPPMMEPLLSDLGYLGDTTEADEILQGTYQPPAGTDYYAKLFLRELRMPDNVKLHPMPQMDVTPEGNRSAWLKQKESVSSEPAGLSFSHYKAGAQDNDINQFDAALRGLPYKYGFSPKHWREITDVEILKKAGVYDIDKMRTITLMDAAYNMNNKQLGRDVMMHAESLNNLAREQYGSRKHHQANTAATNKVLTMDLLRLRRQAGALCSNDAKSCYDRVVHSIAALSLLRQGAPKPAVMSMLQTLQGSIHKIRTGYGVSSVHYGGNRVPPMQGLGQGNGVAPTGWAVISTPLINMMRTAGFGLQVLTCLSEKLIAFLCYAFVDDTDLAHTGCSVDTPGLDVLRAMRRFVTHWEGGLRATGGALRVDKSCWYLIDFVWTNNKWRYASKTDVPGDILVRDADDRQKILPRLEPHVANETLGIFLAMDGNQKAEVTKLRQKTSVFAEQIRTGFIQRDEAWHALNSTILKTLEYPMEAINLTKRQWDYIMVPLLQATLPRSGIVRTFPRDVLYSPDNFTGFGIMHPYHRQHLKHLDLVLRETLKPSITSDLLKSIVEQLRLEIGIPCHDGCWQLDIFGHCLTDCWFRDLLLFCEDEEITIQDTEPTVTLLSSNDSFLMQAFADADYRGSDLRSLNECRMFLKTISLSDISTADGRYITYDAYHGSQQTRIREAGWPRRPPSLPLSHWNLWRRALEKCFLKRHTNRELRFSIGSWLPVSLESWHWFFSPAETRLYHAEGPFYQVYARTSGGRTRVTNSRFSPLQALESALPHDAVLASVAKIARDSFQLTGTASIPSSIPAPSVIYHLLTLDEILALSPLLDRWAVDGFYSEDDGYTIADGILRGAATAVSDGSYKDCIGTSGFILRGANRTIGAIGDNVVPGNPNEQSSYRSELAGISGVLAVVAAVCLKYDLSEGSLTVALDGEQAMLKASSTWPLSPTDTDFDLLVDIRAKILRLPVQICWQWIQGHQDKNTAFHALSGLAQDNVQADNIAKHRLNRCIKDGFIPTSQRFNDEGWSISLQGSKVSKLDYHRLYTTMWAGTALNYWADKHKLPFSTILSIDWDASGDAIRSLTFPQRRRVVKHASGHFGIGVMLQKWGLQNHAECPRCQQKETAAHVLLCPDPRAVTVWETTLTKLDSWMLKKHTNPATQKAIIQRLREWHDGSTISAAPWNCTFKEALKAQNAIGWYPLLMGHVSNHWRAVQQDYYNSLALDNTGKQWVKQLLIQLFNISWDMWDHRNGIKHSALNPALLQEIQLLDSSMQTEFEFGNRDLLSRDKRWFSKPCQTLIEKFTKVEKEQWLASVANARWQWTRRRETIRASYEASRRLFRNWITPAVLPPPNPPA